MVIFFTQKARKPYHTLPPPHPHTELPMLGSCFSYRSATCSKNSVFKVKPEYFGVIQVRRPRNVILQHIHTNHVLANLTLI